MQLKSISDGIKKLLDGLVHCRKLVNRKFILKRFNRGTSKASDFVLIITKRDWRLRNEIIELQDQSFELVCRETDVVN